MANGLMSHRSVKNKRSSKSPKHKLVSKRRKGFSVSRDVRLSNRGVHWVKFADRRGRCEVCSMKDIQSKPNTLCSHCQVFLCMNEKKQCFVEYHEVAV